MVTTGLRPGGFEDLIWPNLEFLKKGNSIIHLGDVALGHEDSVNRRFCGLIPTPKILIRGNHDTRSPSWYIARGWDAVMDGMIMERFGKTILFTHAPKLELPSWVDVNIHGHCHKTLPEGVNHRHILISYELDGYRPQTLKSLLKRLDK